MDLKKLSDVSPLFGAFLVFLGYLKLHWYYCNWDINIAQYLDFSEIILSFLNDTNLLLLYVLILLLNLLFGIATINSFGNQNSSNQNSNNTSNSNLQIEQIPEPIPNIITLYHEKPYVIITTVLVITLSFFGIFWCSMNLIWLYLTFLFFIQLIILSFEKILQITDEKVIFQTAAVVILMSFTYCLSKYDISKTSNYDKKCVFITNYGENIITNKDFIFLGKTNNYYYFYDVSKKQSTIIQESVILKSTTTYFE